MSARGWFVLLLVALLVGVAGFAWTRFEGTAPEIRTPETILVGAAGRSVALEVVDLDSGLRSVTAVLSHAGGEIELASQEIPGTLLSGSELPGEPLRLELTIDPAELPRAAEDAFLRVVATDWSWRGGFSGNEARLDVPVRIDRKPPRVSVHTGLTYVRRGGAGVVVYSIGEPTSRDGVAVGEAFFRGFPAGDRRVAVYAVPTDAPANPTIRVVAEDPAGNIAKARWPVVVNERVLPRSDVRLPASFLESVVPELAAAERVDASDPAEAFRVINTEVRARNERTIREALGDTQPQRLWDGSFQQLSNSQVTSRFAEQRRYFVDGRPISDAVHFGYDLASTQAAPITAAATGRVVYADELGIYGNCVLVDHGLGVGSLYGHLSRLDVEPGQEVTRGDTLGLSGATGLAGGDHLHFAILVGGVYVDPLEWWDPSWMRSNVDARLAKAGP